MPSHFPATDRSGDATTHASRRHKSLIRTHGRRIAAALAAGLLLLLAPALCRSAPAAPEEFPVALGSFSTTLVGSLPARTQNVRLAAAALDGAMLEPGEVLSFNRQIGERSVARGYQAAPVILHETRQIQIGGGVCQVASTLFAASILAGLTPYERWRHSSPVDYIALGEDATIAWGAKDLRLRNDLEQRIRVNAEIVGSTLTVRVSGEREEDATYELETIENETVPGEKGGGLDIDLYRVKKQGGEIVDRVLVHHDRYPPSQLLDVASGR